jgi:hypothetical protein
MREQKERPSSIRRGGSVLRTMMVHLLLSPRGNPILQTKPVTKLLTKLTLSPRARGHGGRWERQEVRKLPDISELPMHMGTEDFSSMLARIFWL